MKKAELAILAFLADALALADEMTKGKTKAAKDGRARLGFIRELHPDLVPNVERFARLRAYATEHGVVAIHDWLHGLMATGLDVPDLEAGFSVELITRSRKQFWAVRSPHGSLRITGAIAE